MLDVAIGLTFVFLLISLICTAIHELIEAKLKNRATDLEQGIKELLGQVTPATTDDTPTDSYLAKIYNHGLVSGIFRGSYIDAKQKKELPSYIPARTFALALMDVVLPGTDQQLSGTASAASSTAPGGDNAGAGGNGAQPGQRVSAQDGADGKALDLSKGPLGSFRAAALTLKAAPGTSRLGQALLTLTDAASNDVAALRANIENWYNGAMDRVSGLYKRRAQFYIFITGLVVAIGMNADAIAVFKSLSNDDALRNSVVAAASGYKPATAPGDTGRTVEQSKAMMDATLTQLEALNLPIGWDWESKPGIGSAVDQAKADSAKAVAQAQTTAAQLVAQARATKQATKDSSAKVVAQATANGGKAVRQATANGATAVKQAQKAAAIRISNLALAIPTTCLGWLQKLLGWLITGVAVSLGAPFWFDVLNKFMVVRSTVKPHEKSLEESSEDRQNKKNS